MKTDRLLAGLDFGAASIAAERWAKEWFAPDAEFLLAHVIAPPDRPRFAHDKLPPEADLEATARDFAEARLREIKSYLSSQPIRTEIRVGKPYEQLAMLATESRADLIVIGPHGGRPHTSRFLGTTAERIVRSSPVPVLVATHPPPGPPRRILVPVDDAEITGPIIAAARRLATRFRAEITLLHVWSNAVYSHVASMSYAAKANEAEAREEISNELRDAGHHWLREIARTGIQRDRVTAAVTHGKPGDATIQLAKAMRADLIVLGRRGTGLVAPALLGSTVGTVLHGSSCPVFVVTERTEATSGA